MTNRIPRSTHADLIGLSQGEPASQQMTQTGDPAWGPLPDECVCIMGLWKEDDYKNKFLKLTKKKKSIFQCVGQGILSKFGNPRPIVYLCCVVPFRHPTTLRTIHVAIPTAKTIGSGGGRLWEVGRCNGTALLLKSLHVGTHQNFPRRNQEA